MCDDATTPYLRVFTVRTTPLPGLDLDSVRVAAQGFQWTRHRTLELWRRIPAGEKQIVAEFEEDAVIDVFEEAA